MNRTILVVACAASALSGVIGVGCGDDGPAARIRSKEIAADFPWDEAEGAPVEAVDLRPTDETKRRLPIERGRDRDELDENAGAEANDQVVTDAEAERNVVEMADEEPEADDNGKPDDDANGEDEAKEVDEAELL